MQRYFILFGFIFIAAIVWYLSDLGTTDNPVLTEANQSIAEAQPDTPSAPKREPRRESPLPNAKPTQTLKSVKLPAPKANFDSYVLALSWMPGFCALADDSREREQCARTRHNGFAVHGLWPNFSDGTWPEFCDAETRSFRAQARQLKNMMASESLAGYQWRKHGSCSDDKPQDYANRIAYIWHNLSLPKLNARNNLSGGEIIAAFLEQNPKLAPSHLFATCRNRTLVEVRICYDKQLNPTQCGVAAQKACPTNNLALN